MGDTNQQVSTDAVVSKQMNAKQKQRQNKKQPTKQQQVRQPRSIKAKAKEHDKLFAEANKLSINSTQEDEDDGWNIDTSEEAVLARRKLQLNEALGNIAAGTIDDSTIVNDVTKILQSSGSVAEKINQIKSIQIRENFGTKRVCGIIFDAAFDENIDKQLGNQIKTAKDVIQEFCSGKDSQKLILGKLEKITVKNNLFSSFKDILFAFYDCGILEEDSVCEWYDVPCTEFTSQEDLDKLRKEAFPFVEWLQSMSEEEEEEESE